MTNLNDTIRRAINTAAINTFEKKYPQVAEWFASDYFHETMVGKGGKLTLRATYRAGNWDYRPCEGLPFQDDTGVVDIQDISEYLTLQGFKVQIESDLGKATYINVSVNFD